VPNPFLGRLALIVSRTTAGIWRLFADLPARAREDAKRPYRLFRANPSYQRLQLKKLEGYWIGCQSDYDRLI